MVNLSDNPVEILSRSFVHAGLMALSDTGFTPSVFAMFRQGVPNEDGLCFEDGEKVYVVIVVSGERYAVYFGGELGYTLEEPNHRFFADVAMRFLHQPGEHQVYLDRSHFDEE